MWWTLSSACDLVMLLRIPVGTLEIGLEKLIVDLEAAMRSIVPVRSVEVSRPQISVTQDATEAPLYIWLTVHMNRA